MGKAVRILLTSPAYPPSISGLANAVQMQARLLIELGHEVDIATGGDVTGSRIDPELKVKIFQFNVSGEKSILHPIKGDDNEYKKFLLNSKYDFVIFNAWQIWSTDIAIGILHSIPGKKILYSHGISTNVFFKNDLIASIIRYTLWRPYWWGIKNTMRNFDGIIFLSENGIDSRFDDIEIAKKLGIKYSVIPNPISYRTQEFLLGKKAAIANRRSIISVGSYFWTKGHDFVLRAYAGSEFKNRIPLKIFGQKFNSYTDKLRSLSASIGIDENMVSFHDGVSENLLLEAYLEASLFIGGSITECQPLVLLDAMATGLPFIARSTGCIPFMGGGVVVNSEFECAQSMNYFLGNQGELELLAAQGIHEISTKYSPKIVRGQLDAFLNSYN
jgi:glycosyltransferase involved in cell wall biosynthesis